MAARGLSLEWQLRLIVLGTVVGLPLGILGARWIVAGSQPHSLHARVAENGGWLPADLTVRVGEPLRLRLTSDDVLHGFAVGQQPWPAVDVEPGRFTSTEITFDRPGRYVFYCSRWCGPGHWRMRGTIEVTGAAPPAATPQAPLYVRLGQSIDDPHLVPPGNLPSGRPSASRGAALAELLPSAYREVDYYRAHSPFAAWQELRAEPGLQNHTDDALWDAVAWLYRSRAAAAAPSGAPLYAANCAACHGEQGGGDGVMAEVLDMQAHGVSGLSGSMTERPRDFTSLERLLGASPAVLHGKLLRGGMGTGMPYFGPIFTEPQAWTLVDLLWTFVFAE